MSSNSVPPPPKGIENTPGWAEDSKAKFENENWDKEDELQGVQLNNNILWARVYGAIVAAFMVFFAFAFVVSVGAWLAHYVTPWAWLTPEQLSKIQSVIFSGSLGAVVSAYAQKHIVRLDDGQSQRRIRS